jgi:hypothetical protein
LPRGVLIRHESQKPGKNWRTDLKTLNEEISWATSAEKCISRYKATAIDENPSFTECKTTNCKTSLCRETDTFFHKDWTICELACEMDLVLGISKFYFSTKFIYYQINIPPYIVFGIGSYFFTIIFFFMLNFEIHRHLYHPIHQARLWLIDVSLYCLIDHEDSQDSRGIMRNFV